MDFKEKTIEEKLSEIGIQIKEIEKEIIEIKIAATFIWALVVVLAIFR
jgi:NOL1/NOP2/fmu family ribosome biogenesis protein